MSQDICAFCLGDSSEVPPFGSIKDARDLIHPCSTCSLVTHKKCLMDWFNSVPVQDVFQELSISEEEQTLRVDAGGPSLSGNGGNANDEANNIANNRAEANVLNTSLLSNWASVLEQYGAVSSQNSEHLNAHLHSTPGSVSVVLCTPCPQCRSHIRFKLERSGVLALNSLLKSSMTNALSYCTIGLGISGALTGVITMSYVTLVRCGLSVIDALVPASLLHPMSRSRGFETAGSGILQSYFQQQQGRIGSNYFFSQLHFQHIPFLPLMLYRARDSSITDCIFSPKSRTLFAKILDETLICGFVSSLGKHKLVRQLYANLTQWIREGPTTTGKLFGLSHIFKNINLWDPYVMVGSLIPYRWLYDLIYRLTFNRAHFALKTSFRPREIANSLTPDELTSLETLHTKIASLRCVLADKFKNSAKGTTKNGPSFGIGLIRRLVEVLCDKTLYKFVYFKILSWIKISKVCLKHDYSLASSHRSTAMTIATTFLWPFLAADLGKFVFWFGSSQIKSLSHVDKDKLLFMSNLLSLGIIAVAKDFGNLYLAYQRARQSNLVVLLSDEPNPNTLATRESLPIQLPGWLGAYVNN